MVCVYNVSVLFSITTVSTGMGPSTLVCVYNVLVLFSITTVSTGMGPRQQAWGQVLWFVCIMY